MKNFYLLFTLLFVALYSQAQNCGTADQTPAERAYFLNTIKNISLVKNSSTTCIPLKVYVFRQDDGTGGVSNEDLNKGLSNLNNKYYDAGIEFFYSSLPTYIDSSDLNYYNQQSPDNDTEAQLVAAAGQVTDAVNIYFVQSITLSSGFQANGYAYFPSASTNSNRIVMTHDAAAGNANGTYAHEFGHYFSLPHTHQGTENGSAHANAENVPRTGSNANCSTHGDSFCDTDADPRYSNPDFNFLTCSYTGSATDINGVTYAPATSIINIMSYYPDQCVTQFSAEQYTAIAQGLVARQGFTNYNFTAAPMTVSAPTGLTATDVGGVALSWTDNASNEMGYVIERSTTSATSGFTALVEGGTAENATSFTDLTANSANTTYYYRVKASNGDCNTYSNVDSVTVLYCTAFATTCDEILTNVTIGTINNSTTAADCNTSTYQNFSNLSTDLTIGVAEPISMTVSPSYSTDTIVVWIDWNQDGDFEDADEFIFLTSAFSGSVNENITAPATALAGNTRMRIRLFYNHTGNSPCGGANYGEVEDYTVNVVVPAANCASETFNNASPALPSSYSTGTFTGDNGLTWNYVASRNDAGYQINGAGILLRRSSDNSAVSTTSVPGGIGDFTCSLLKGFTGSGNRQVELFVNGVSQGTSIAWDNTNVQTFSVPGINISGNVTLEIRNITSKQVVVDDISWTCYAGSGPVGTPTVELTASANAGTEAGTTSITLTATASAAVTANETITLAVTGTNITTADYTNAASITILNGSNTGTTTFDVADDAVNEITEMANVHISALSAGLDSGTVVSQNILITDNDNPSITVPAACSFETAATGGQYIDDAGFDGDTDHDLINNATQASVDYLYTGAGEIGFDAFYLDGQGSVGLTDGDFVGVSNYTVDVGAYTQGSNGYQMSDLDGIMQVVFDSVSLAGFASYNLSVDFFINSTGYEAADYLRIYVIVDGGVELDLINTTGLDIDNLNIEGAWNTLNQSLTGYTTAQLIIEGSTNSGTEAFYFDNILFTGSNNPVIDIADASLSGFTYLQGNGPSAEQTTTVTWANLVDSVSSLNTVNFFEFSVDGGTTYTPANIALNVNIPPFPATYGPQNVEVRLVAGLAAGMYYDTIYISTDDGSGGLLNDTVYLSGEVTAPTAPCSQLFISEYGEPNGGSNKYLEIYNPTATTVDLSNYQIWKISNGGNWPENSFTLSGNLLSGDVVVIAASAFNTNVDIINSNINFTGDDAMGLAYNGGSGSTYTLIDAVGTDGADPGNGWAVAGVANGTQNKILIRKSTVQAPNDDWATSAGTNATDSEWEVVNPYTGGMALPNLGAHISDCIDVDYVWTGATDSDWNTASNWSSNVVPGATDSVTIPDVSGASGNFPTITPAVTLANVEVEANASLNITTGMVLNGTFTNNGTVILEDGAYLDDFTNAGAAFIGNIIVETVAANGVSNDQRFISSPVNAPNVSEIGDDLLGPWGAGLPGTNGVAVTIDNCALLTTTATSNYGNLFEFDETLLVSCEGDGWVVRSSGNMQNARGYSAYLPNGSTFDFEGAPNTGAININVTNSGSAVANGEGWNVIGNPYPSPIDRNSVIAAGATDAQYFVTSGVYQGTFFPYLPGSNIAIAQGFQVHVNSNATINMDNSFRNTNAATWYQTENWFDHKLEISVFGNNFADKAILFYNEQASNAYEAMYDVEKYNPSIGQPKLAIANNGKELSLSGMHVNDLGETVPMTFNPGTAGSFSIDANGMETFPANTNIYLKDKMLGVVHSFENGDYNFTSNVNDIADRFEIIFIPEVEFSITNIDCEGEGGTIQPSSTVDAGKYFIYENDVLMNYGALLNMNETLAQGAYEMTLVDKYGGEQNYTFNIDAAEQIDASFELSSHKIEVGEVLYLTNLTNNAENISWQIADDVLENVQSPSYTFEKEGLYTITLNVSNEDCADSKESLIEVTNKTTSIVSENEVNTYLYPNPVKQALHIVSDQEVNVKVYSLIGELIIETNNKTIDFNNLDKGVYFVQIQDNKGETLLNNKVIKE